MPCSEPGNKKSRTTYVGIRTKRVKFCITYLLQILIIISLLFIVFKPIHILNYNIRKQDKNVNVLMNTSSLFVDNCKAAENQVYLLRGVLL